MCVENESHSNKNLLNLVAHSFIDLDDGHPPLTYTNTLDCKQIQFASLPTLNIYILI